MHIQFLTNLVIWRSRTKAHMAIKLPTSSPKSQLWLQRGDWREHSSTLEKKITEHPFNHAVHSYQRLQNDHVTVYIINFMILRFATDSPGDYFKWNGSTIRFNEVSQIMMKLLFLGGVTEESLYSILHIKAALIYL